MKTARFHTSLVALALVGALSACGGGGGGSSSPSVSPIAGTDTTTLQSQLGITAGVDNQMRAARVNGNTDKGVVRLNDDIGRIEASVDGFTTQGVGPNNPTTAVMDGQVSRAQGADGVFYVPRKGSDMHVGMVHMSNGETGFAGIFGKESGAAVTGERRAAGGTAVYAGSAEYTQDIGRQAAGYRGQMTATADFNTGGLNYASTMSRFSDTGGDNTMRMNGAGVIGNNGDLTGTYTVDANGGSSGTTSGALYGPNGQNIGMIFTGTNNAGVGGAILNERTDSN